MSMINFHSMECPWCGEDIDSHEPSTCLDAWTATLMGHKVKTIAPGEPVSMYLGDDRFQIVTAEKTPPIDGQLFVELDREVYGEGHQGLRHVFSAPCVTAVPNYSGSMNFHLAWDLVDEASMLEKKERDIFFQLLERELRKRAGDDIGGLEFIFHLKPYIFCRAFIKTKLMRLSKLEDLVLAADNLHSA